MMKQKFRLGEKEFSLEVISVRDLSNKLRFGCSARALKQILKFTKSRRIKVTPTSPKVFVELDQLVLEVPDRPFFGLMSELQRVEEKIVLNWVTDGF